MLFPKNNKTPITNFFMESKISGPNVRVDLTAKLRSKYQLTNIISQEAMISKNVFFG